MEEENFNWLEEFIKIQNKKDIKLSNDFKVLNSNNIDTYELTNNEPDKDAGVVELNYKDEEVKETDGYNYVKGALAFVRDMPEETIKSLMLAFLNGVDVTANASAVIFNSMVSVDPAMQAAFQNKDLAKFQKSFNTNVQTFSKYLEGEKKQVKEIGQTSGENSKGAEFVAMIVQDTPYALPIYKKFKSMGMPSYVALPIAYGMGSGIAFDDDATLFLNSEQVQSFKEMIKVLPNSSEEKIYNTTFRMFEGTSLGFLIPKIFNGLKFAKNTIPKYMDQQASVALGTAATTGAVVDKVTATENEIKEPSTDAEIDMVYGEGASEKAMNDALKPKTNKDMQNIITAAEKADDQVLFFNEDDMTETKEDEPLNAYITITDPQALKGSDIVFYDEETMEQMTYQNVNESDDNWIILNKDRETTSYKQ